jgi:hypothetical protein
MQVVSKPVVWPAGIRRASINSFGFGGTNSHVILEDAFHFIENEGLTANHTSCAHPSVEQISFNGSLISECTANGNDAPDAYGNEAHTNGDNIHEAKTNGSLTTESQVTAEPPLSRALEKTIGKSSYLRIVTWSASEESGIERMAPAWKSYFEGLSLISNESELFIDNLAHTLNGRRSRLPWMTYALMDGNTKLDGVVENWKPPIRSQESHNIAYVFSGVSVPKIFKTRRASEKSNSKGLNGPQWVASYCPDILCTAIALSRQVSIYRVLAVNGICLVSFPPSFTN